LVSDNRFGMGLSGGIGRDKARRGNCAVAMGKGRMDRLGIEMLTAFGMPPVDYIHLAADLGCGHISLGLGQMPWNPCGFPAWSLKDDKALQRAVKSALETTGVVISLAEGFGIRPGVDVRDRVAELDLFAAFGAERVNTVIMDADRDRSLDQIAALADLSAERGIGMTLEFAPAQVVKTMGEAVDLLNEINRPNASLAVDAMHFFRSGGDVAQIAAIDPAMIGYAQLCDVPLPAPHDDYFKEACFERLAPGDGELPLAAFIDALPEGVPIGLEVPMVATVEGGRFNRAPIARAVNAARTLLA
jgi:sugar phosphate isomerase/epimerase